MKFIIAETDEILVSHSGPALAGAILQGTQIRKRASAIRLGDRKPHPENFLIRWLQRSYACHYGKRSV